MLLKTKINPYILGNNIIEHFQGKGYFYIPVFQVSVFSSAGQKVKHFLSAAADANC